MVSVRLASIPNDGDVVFACWQIDKEIDYGEYSTKFAELQQQQAREKAKATQQSPQNSKKAPEPPKAEE